MPYKFKGKRDCKQSDGTKGKFLTIKKNGKRRCYKSEKQYKAAQAWAHEADEEEHDLELIERVISRILRESPEQLTRFWFERSGIKKNFHSYVKSCPKLYETLPSPYIIPNSLYKTEFWFTDLGLQKLSTEINCLQEAGNEDGWQLVSESRSYNVPAVTGVPGHKVPGGSIVEPGLVLAYRDDLQVAFYRRIK
jgi:hypothetical protein